MEPPPILPGNWGREAKGDNRLTQRLLTGCCHHHDGERVVKIAHSNVLSRIAANAIEAVNLSKTIVHHFVMKIIDKN